MMPWLPELAMGCNVLAQKRHSLQSFHSDLILAEAVDLCVRQKLKMKVATDADLIAHPDE